MQSYRIFFVLLMMTLLAILTPQAFSANGEVTLSQDQFISPDFESAKRTEFISLGADLKSKPDENTFLKVDISGQFTPSENLFSYLNVKELYWKDGQESGLSVGRKKENWSRLDSVWKLGMFEPLFLWSPMNPEPQGLTGVFSETRHENWGLTLFASFVFIPDQGPNYEIKDGSFEKAHPWFHNPPSYVRFFNQTDKVNYDIQKPESNDVIFNRSFVGEIHLGRKNKDFFFQAAFANKPANQFSLGFDGYLTGNQTAQVQVFPKVYYHNLISSEFYYTALPFRAGVSGVAEKPENPSFSDDLTFVQYSNSSLMSPFIELEWSRFKAEISYLKIQGGEGVSQGQLVTSGDSILPERYPFREAIMIKTDAVYRLSRKRILGATLKFLRGMQNEFSAINLDSKITLTSDWAGYFGLQLIAASDSVEAQKTQASQFQNNDSLRIGVNYVF